jgi:hypothetical protein
MDNARIIDPETYIGRGEYPCNTYVSWRFLKPVPKDDGEYPHEGLDFSGQLANLMPRWYSRLGCSGSDGLGLNWNRMKKLGL